MKIRTKATGTDKKGARRSTLNPLVFTKGALLYGVTSVCALCEAKQPGHLNVWGVLRHFVPNKGYTPFAALRLTVKLLLRREIDVCNVLHICS